MTVVRGYTDNTFLKLKKIKLIIIIIIQNRQHMVYDQ